MPKLLHLDKIAQTTCVILDKVVDRYLVDADYRQLFGFSPLLEQLILLPTGYDQKIPIQRLDLFLDEESGDFRFCEFNTDGTSAMNEDRETTNALSRTACYQSLKEQHRVERQELFENWIDAFLDIYQASKQAVENPQIAIVDYLASGRCMSSRNSPGALSDAATAVWSALLTHCVLRMVCCLEPTSTPREPPVKA